MDNSTRIERDSLGEVPGACQQALYGVQTQRAVLEFPDLGLAPLAGVHLVDGHHQARRGRGATATWACWTSQRAGAIVQAAQEVIDGRWDDQFVVDPFQAGAGTSHNMNANEVIANRATQILGGELGEYRVNPNDHVNMAQSTNDTIPTAIRLGALWRLDELLDAVDGLAAALQAESASSSTTSSNPGAPTCRTPCRCAWARSSAPMPGPWSAMPSASAAPPKGCAGWGSAARRPAPG